ncbi:MAG TPA: hypothetical protein DIW80_12585 [Gordonia polyisoprenivorans]|nr:hypothetical protein [Gordonia polyisoprenivorans]
MVEVSRSVSDEPYFPMVEVPRSVSGVPFLPMVEVPRSDSDEPRDRLHRCWFRPRTEYVTV